VAEDALIACSLVPDDIGTSILDFECLSPGLGKSPVVRGERFVDLVAGEAVDLHRVLRYGDISSRTFGYIFQEALACVTLYASGSVGVGSIASLGMGRLLPLGSKGCHLTVTVVAIGTGKRRPRVALVAFLPFLTDRTHGALTGRHYHNGTNQYRDKVIVSFHYG